MALHLLQCPCLHCESNLVKAKDAARDRGADSQRKPLIFGVSGHRDLRSADLPQLRAELAHIFASFRAAYPNTPFRLLTPLAEGADRLAAEVALASGVDLFVPLPMEQGDYERDFATPESLAEFRALLAMARSRWEIPVSRNARMEERTSRYAEVGELIARESNVLILLWDGEENKKVGGTAWVRKRREHWLRESAHRNPERNAFAYGPTIQVVTPRVSGRSPRPRLGTIGELPPSAVEFATALSKNPNPRRQEDEPGHSLPYQLIFWNNDQFNAGLGDASSRKES